jgi:hypothetical protein
MSRTQEIAPQQPLAAEADELELHDAEQQAYNGDQVDLRQLESKRKRWAVLVGVAILQLPIWGILTPYPINNSAYTYDM